MSAASGGAGTASRRPLAMFVTEQIESGGKRSHVETLMAGLETTGWRARLLDRAALGLFERAWIGGPTRLLNRFGPAAGHAWAIPRLNERFAAHLEALRRRDPPQVVHAQEPVTFAGVRRGSPGIPLALTVHGPVHREVASAHHLELDHPLVRRLRALEVEAYAQADAVVSVDQAHAAYVKELGRTGPVWVIPNFVDTRRFHPGVTPVTADPATERWIAGRPLILCPRRLVPKNGVAVAIRALHALAARRVRAALLVTGDGPQRAELTALIASLGLAGSVRLAGDVPYGAMPGWSRRADVVLVPSVPSRGVEEATSISVLEAQACGRPVIASAIGGLREIVADGVTGLLLPAGDAEAFADAIARVLADPALARRLGETGAARVRERHSHVAAARAYAEVYRAIGVALPAD